jgi:hypothetical protein
MSIIGLEIRLNLLLRENCFKKKICEQKEKMGLFKNVCAAAQEKL